MKVDTKALEEHRKEMRELAELIDMYFNGKLKKGEKPKIGFVLLTAKFNDVSEGRVNYISNGERSSMVTMMKEFIARAEGRYADGNETKN